MYDVGKHFRLESQSRNPALAFAAILVVFGTFVTLSQRRSNEALITESIGVLPSNLGSQLVVEQRTLVASKYSLP